MLEAAAITARAQKTVLKPTTRQVVLKLARNVPWQKTTHLTQLRRGADALALLVLSAAANATWTSCEYWNENGEYRYGIRNADNFVPLNEKNRGKADKAAKKMNKNKSSVMAGPNGEGDYRGDGNLPR